MENNPKKSLGQNFLTDSNIINKIVDLGTISKNDLVFEIGPGTGNLTKEIINKNPKKIFLIEKDSMLTKKLKTNYKEKVIIFNQDIMKFNENSLSKSKERLIVFGNLPYNISTQILVKWILNNGLNFWYKKLILMFQKDVAERIIAKTGTKNYGRLSIISNWKLQIQKHFDVSKNCFFPKPNVESSVLSFVPKINFTKFKNSRNLEKVTRIFFSQKRKMINKPLRKLFKNKNEFINQFNLNLRPGNLSKETYYEITKEYEKSAN
mgnify:CR=1 FL=1